MEMTGIRYPAKSITLQELENKALVGLDLQCMQLVHMQQSQRQHQQNVRLIQKLPEKMAGTCSYSL